MLASAPVDVGGMLKRELFDRVGTVVLTSATLAVGGGRRGTDAQESAGDGMAAADADYAYLKRRLGVAEARSQRLGSPFDYARQAELILVDRLPDPAAREAYDRAVVMMIQRSVE
ncbi:MAG: hypothetical protein ACKOWG_12530, partial [Planctomycetia bacterium]